jgi:cell division protein FtsB
MASDVTELTASNLKEVLWTTMKDLQSGWIQPGQGDAIAAQAREILRTVKTQLQVTSQAKRSVPADVISFAEK